MDKYDIGNYYTQIPFGERSFFIAVVSARMGETPDKWRRTINEWSKGNTAGKPLPPVVHEEFVRLMTNSKWRYVYYDMVNNNSKTTASNQIKR